MRSTFAALVVAVLAVGAAACSSPSAQEREERRSELLDALGPELQDRLARRVEVCEQAIGDVLNEINELDSRLEAGLNYSEYKRQVADLKVAYDRASYNGLDTWCLTARSKAGRALRVYLGAAGYWDVCSDLGDCTTDEIESELQEYWARARQWLEEARVALDNVASPPGDRALPRSGASVPGSIYATIRETFCKEPDPPALEEPCRQLRATLLGGIDEGEEGELEDELEAMLDALEAEK